MSQFAFKLDLLGETSAVAPAPVTAPVPPVTPAEAIATDPADENAELERETAAWRAGGPLPKFLRDLDKLDPRTKRQAHLDPYNETLKATAS